MRLDGHQALELQQRAIASGDLLIWTIYRHPSDFPDKYVARPFSGRRNAPYPVEMVADDLETLRGELPAGLVQMDRNPADDPVIVETWL